MSKISLSKIPPPPPEREAPFKTDGWKIECSKIGDLKVDCLKINRCDVAVRTIYFWRDTIRDIFLEKYWKRRNTGIYLQLSSISLAQAWQQIRRSPNARVFIFLHKVENTVDLAASEDEGGQDIFLKASEFATVLNSERSRELTTWKRTWIFSAGEIPVDSGGTVLSETASRHRVDYSYSESYVRHYL